MADSSKSFYLQWDKFSSTCCVTFRNLLNSEEYSDVTLYCQGKFIKCHRIILSASSQFFKTLLQNVHHSNPIVAVPNIELCDLEALITFIYTGEVTVACNQLDSLVKIGELLKVNGLGDEEAKAPKTPVEMECRKSKRRKTESVESPYSQSGVVFIDSPVFDEIKQENMVMSSETMPENIDIGNDELDEAEHDNLMETDMSASALESCLEEDGSYFEAGAVESFHFTDVEKENGTDVEDRLRKLFEEDSSEKWGNKKPRLVEKDFKLMSTLKYCVICKKEFVRYTKSRKIDHYAIDHREYLLKPLLLPCSCCNYIAQTYNALQIHVRRKHQNTRTCGNVVNTEPDSSPPSDVAKQCDRTPCCI